MDEQASNSADSASRFEGIDALTGDRENESLVGQNLDPVTGSPQKDIITDFQSGSGDRLLQQTDFAGFLGFSGKVTVTTPSTDIGSDRLIVSDASQISATIIEIARGQPRLAYAPDEKTFADNAAACHLLGVEENLGAIAPGDSLLF